MRRHLVSAIFATAVLGLVALAAATGQGYRTPKAAFNAFIDAMERLDWNVLRKTVRGLPARPTVPMDAKQADRFSIQVLSVTFLERGETATADVRWRLKSDSRPRDLRETLHMVRLHGNWYLVPSPEPKATTPPMALNTAIAQLSLRQPRQGVARHQTPEAVAALSNVKQLATGMLILVEDHNSRFAVTQADWPKKILGYLQNRAVLTVPPDRPGTVSFQLNPALIGKPFASLKNPSRVVLFYLGKNRQPEFRFDGRSPISFADGSARLITREDMKLIRWDP